MSEKREEERSAFLMRMSPDLVAWLDEEAKRADRSRTYLIEHACRMWRRRLDRERRRRDG